MKRLLPVACLAALLLSAGCRHHVTARDAGRVDGERSITSSSDTSWTIRSEPRSEPEEASEASPTD